MAQNQSDFCDKGRFIIDRNKIDARRGLLPASKSISAASRRQDFDKAALKRQSETAAP
jgi:hypothetical protein